MSSSNGTPHSGAKALDEPIDRSAEPAEGAGQEAPAGGPDGAEAESGRNNKRRFPRAQVDLLVKMKFGSVQEFLNATAEDLSVGGMFLRSAHFGEGGQLREKGQLLAMQFDAGERRMVEGLCRVVRVVTPDEPGMVPGVGVEFVELDDKSRQLIEAIVTIKTVKPFGDE